MIELTASDGHKFLAYRANPSETPKGAVVIIQDLFGVNPCIRKTADRFAANGYVAIAPSLFDRVRPDVALGYDDAAYAEGMSLAEQVGKGDAISDIQATVDAVKDASKVAIVGFGWGGYLAYVSGNRVNGLACSIGYYSDAVVKELSAKRKIPTLLHFAERDSRSSPDEVTLFRASRPDVSVFTYPAGHGFDCDEQIAYSKGAAQTAQERTSFWVSQYVEGQPPVTLKNAGAYAQAKSDKKKQKKKKDDGDDLGPPMD
ncbi:MULTISPECIES: dienelactone hydrolase family protein [unclassified Hyphomicrobium]|uniref:dienelactone hydrolase family protein n=1 Tax=unclassified Hyphomicrobium TaxID=2619925 RepID=UPI000213D613|nr:MULTISPECIES: dienelactone hydrolase family protein [unclassified Hyphomicrobium]CCB66858.1 Dienelactone hydrolase [Hyphomicrobium sp. MC1]